MKKTMCSLVLLVVMSAAKAYTGTEMLIQCQSGNKEYQFCMGYMSGTIETLVDYNYLCPPEDVTVNQLVTMTQKWLREHPQNWHEPVSAPLILVALQSHWICKGALKRIMKQAQ